MAVGLLFLTFVASALGEAISLTKSNFDDEVFGKGKAAFVKFFAPWCGHCKKMKPDWDKLAGDFASSKTVLIADVDCTVEKDLCSTYGVRGYPTIKYFTGNTAATGDDYEGGRDYSDLKAFADENLGPSCSIDNRDLCSAEQLKAMDAIAAMKKEDVAAEIAAITKAVEDAEQLFKDEVQKLQNKYQELQQENEKAKTESAPRLKLLRMVSNQGAKAGKEEL
eukprot:g63005.t1